MSSTHTAYPVQIPGIKFTNIILNTYTFYLNKTLKSNKIHMKSHQIQEFIIISHWNLQNFRTNPTLHLTSLPPRFYGHNTHTLHKFSFFPPKHSPHFLLEFHEEHEELSNIWRSLRSKEAKKLARNHHHHQKPWPITRVWTHI
jgi:hypothetical protein